MTKGMKTGGRSAGILNKRTIARQADMKEAIQVATAAIPKEFLFEGNGLELLTAVYKDTRNPMHTRIEAATKAAQYESPKLQAVPAMGGGAGSNPVRGEIVHSLTPESAAMVLKLIS